MSEQETPAYIRGYLEKKISGKKWVKYWCIIKGTMVFFFSDPNTHIPENFVGSIILGPKTKTTKDSDYGFKIKTDDKGTFLFRCENELRRTQWLYAIDLSSRLQPPSALPGEELFDSSPVAEPNQYDSVTNQRIPRLSRSNTLPSPNRSCLNKLEHRKSSLDGAETETMYDELKLVDGSWYVSKLSRQESEELLLEQPVGTFVVRDSETARFPGCYTLSIRRGDRVFHHKIETQSLGLILKGHEQYKFKDLDDLVKFFAHSQKDIKVRAYSTASGSSSKSRHSSIDEGPEYEYLKDEDEVFNDYQNIGQRMRGDGADEKECGATEESLSKGMKGLQVQDTSLDPNTSRVPLPSPPLSEESGKLPYIHMRPSTGKEFVPTPDDGAVDSEYLPMGPSSGSPTPGDNNDYINMGPTREVSSPGEQSYINMPPPLKGRESTPPLPPRQTEKRTKSVYTDRSRTPPLPQRNGIKKKRSQSVYCSPVSFDSFHDTSSPPQLPPKKSDQPPLPDRRRPPLVKSHTLGHFSNY